MAKIFRLHTEADNTITGWGNTSKYGSNVINQILDPNGATAKREITSIPSPFARMDLVKTAFNEVVNSKNLKGNTIYHKMVSDSLDIGQIFFNYENLHDQVDIIIWDKENDIQQLLDSSLPGHKELGETYRIFLQQDADTFNFNSLKRIYLLNFKNGPSQINIIGATSPSTLFFSPANDLSYVSPFIRFGNDMVFDESYTPLYERDIEYQKYWYLLQKSFPNFPSLFPEVNAYLNDSFRQLSPAHKNTVQALKAQDINNYNILSINGAGNPVEILNYPIHTCIPPILKSDFEIKPFKTCYGLKPLVLPVTTFISPIIYTSANWDRNTKVPFKDSRSLNNRMLPGDIHQYPYLTISDFLEDTIIRLPYKLNREAYFDGNINKDDKKSYLLPLTNLFFEYFSISQLMGVMNDGKKMIELKSNAGGITVVLRIPIKKEYIEYSRTYFENNLPKIDSDNNIGALVDRDFALALFPNIRFEKDEFAHYRIGLISSYNDNNEYTVTCIKENAIVSSKDVVRNDIMSNYRKCQIIVLEESNFDVIRINNVDKSGIIVPLFKEQKGADQYTFGIDFGTTNTHVEYSINGLPSKPFDIKEDDKQIHMLLSAEGEQQIEQYIFDFDFIPELIGNNGAFRFPMRTALSHSLNTKWDAAVIPMAHVNIPFPFEKRNEYKYNRILTGLKWSNDIDNSKKVRSYIETLFLILRNKVILNNGSLSDTKIVWFYPISMTFNRFNLFKQAWQEAYLKYFGNDLNNIIQMTESLAPYEYYKSSIPAASNLVTVDIGGGTSDIVVAEAGVVKYITSFRFAANSLFNNKHSSSHNGIIRQFEEEIVKKLLTSDLGELYDIYKKFKDDGVSANLASFFFSLSQNKNVEEKDIESDVDFNKILQADGIQKINFLIFYVAIIYYLAHLMKAKELKMPRHITFSGNGSKVIQILTSDKKLLEKFTKIIFEKIYDDSYPTDGLGIVFNAKNPKEATCKGGITHQRIQEYSEIIENKVVLKGADLNSFISTEKYSDINTDEYVEQITTQINKFIDFTLNLNGDVSFLNNFGVENQSLEIAKIISKKDIGTFIKEGLKEKLKEVSTDDTVEETLFFYPINGILNAVSTEICETNKKNDTNL